MPKAISGDTNPDAYLTNFSYALQADDTTFVAGAASSRIAVTQESGKFDVYPPGYFWRDEAQVRPLGGRPVQVTYGMTEDTYNAEEWALEHVVDDRTRQNSRQQGRIDENATRLLTGKQMIRADRLWATSFFKDGVWSMQVDGAAADPGEDEFLYWDDAASTPISDIEDWKELIRAATGMEPNVLVLGSKVRKTLKNHPEFIDRTKYTSSAAITNAIMAALFEVDQVRVARALYNTAAERMPDPADKQNMGGKDLQFIVDPNSAWLGYIDPNPSLNSPTSIAMFAWDSLVPGQTNDMGGVISRGRDGRAYSDYFHSRQAFGFKKVADDMAVFIRNAVR
jgi:hypothetical protein